jgi:long-chain acyl-CoA synthetase
MKASFAVSRIATTSGTSLQYDHPSALNLRELLECSRQFPAARPYLVQDDRILTFGDLIPAVGGLSHFLRTEAAMNPGDRVAIAASNCIEWALTAWAATVSGAVVVGLNSWWHPLEAKQALELTTPRLLVVDEAYLELLQPMLGDLDFIDYVFVIGDPRVVPDGVVALPTTLMADLPTAVAIDPDSVATLLFTSGTTGKSKAVQGTHRNACDTFQNTQWMGAEYFPGVALRQLSPAEHPCTVLSAPMFHVAGLQWGFMFPAATGTTVVLNTGRYSPLKTLDLALDSHATSLGGVPTTLLRILDLPDLDQRDLSGIVSVSWGGAPAPPDMAQRCVDTFPNLALVGTGYGLTETCGLGVYAAGSDLLRHPTTAGRALPCVEVRIADPSGAVVPPEEEGEIQMRGSIVMTGYWANAEATAEVLSPDGWFRTGDLGYLSQDGFLFITGRIKEIIIRGGENVYPVEIENVLRLFPGVVDAGVAGRPHAELGEEVIAYVQALSGSGVTEENLKAHVRAQLAGFKVPTSISVGADVVPRNAAGKILRDAIAGASLRFTQVL